MIRVRVPGGVATPNQWLEMDRIANTHANHTLKLTTRQAFQFHGVVKGVLKQTMVEINRSCLDTIAACGDVNRNVMCNPTPHISEAHAATLQLSQDISDHLTPATGAYQRDLAQRRRRFQRENHPRSQGDRAALRQALPPA